MEKLVREIRRLAVENKIVHTSLSSMKIDLYTVSILISSGNGKPSNSPENYRVRVTALNTLINNNPYALPKSWPMNRILSDDLRRNILDNVKEGISVCLNKSSSLNDWSGLTEHPKGEESLRDKIEDEYVKRFFLLKDDIIQLHRFHSPLRIPRGYTEQEIRLCISLISLHDNWVESYPLLFPPTLGEGLFIDINKSASRTETLKTAVFKMLLDLANRPQNINS
jgi:hypothetical protein